MVLSPGPAMLPQEKPPLQCSHTLDEMLLSLVLDHVLEDGLVSLFKPIQGVLIGVLPWYKKVS